MIPGVVAQQQLLSIGGVTPTTPTLRVFEASSAAASTNFAVALPSGWMPGDLCVLVSMVPGTNSATAVPAGWTRFSRATATGLHTTDVYYRVLEVGDSNPNLSVSASLPSATLAYVFTTGTFDAATPILTGSAQGFSSSSVTLPILAGATIAAGTHLAIFTGATGRASAVTVSTYPGTLYNQSLQSSSGSNHAVVAASFAEFAGGASPAGSFVFSATGTTRGFCHVIKGAA